MKRLTSILLLITSVALAQTKVREGSQTQGALPTAQGGVPIGGTAGQTLTKNSGTDYDASWLTPSAGGLVNSVFGRTGDVVAQTGDYLASQVTNAVDSSSSYANPAWISSLIWSKITSTPTTLSGYGITDAQPLDSDLTSIAALSTTSFGRGALTQTDATAFRSYIGAGTGGGDVSSNTSVSVDSEIALFNGTTGKSIKRATGSGIATVASGVLGTITDNSANWDTAFTDRLKWDGGATGLVPATGRTSLGLVIGTNVQAWNSQLDAISALSTTTYGRGILESINAAGAQSYLSLVIGVDVQAFAPTLSSWAAVTRASGFDTFATTPSSANLRALLTDENGTGAALFSGATSPTFVTPNLGTPSTLVGTNITGTASAFNIGGSAATLSISGQTGLLSFTGLGSTNRTKTVRDAVDTILEQGGGTYTPSGTWVWTSCSGCSWPTFNQNTTGSAATLTTARNLWGQSFNGSANIGGAIELGTAGTTDTTLDRSSAGVVSVEGVKMLATNSTSGVGQGLVAVNSSSGAVVGIQNRAAGSSSSGSAGTNVATITAGGGNQLVCISGLTGQTNAASTQMTVTITYSDSTTTSDTTAAATAQNQFVNDGGIMRTSNVVANSNKKITSVAVTTAGTGTGARVAALSAVEIPQ